MSELTFVGNYKKNFIGDWTGLTSIRKPIIAAVNGFAVSTIITSYLRFIAWTT
jgi:enoyl-CoA hydratase/carnithine racemase